MSAFRLRYTGHAASKGELDFYDAAQALIGFERSLALTTHLALNGEIITQAPSLQNARLFVAPPRAGSWEIVATAVIGALGTSALAPKDSVLGHFTRSLYDYALNTLMGIDVDFDSTIRKQYGALCDEKKITEAKADALAEKCETAVLQIHRPIVKSVSAQRARLTYGADLDQRIGPAFTPETYEHAVRTVKLKRPEQMIGYVSSYNSNTYKGRIFLPELERPIPFELADENRGRAAVRKITASLSINAVNRSDQQALVTLTAFRHESSQGRLKSLWVTEVS
jgi:hypothetical protein